MPKPPQHKKWKFGSFLRQCDFFGHPITFTYKRHSEYRSEVGGVMSLIVFIGMLIYALIIFK